MNMILRQCEIEDFDVLREFSIRTYYETFAQMNTSEDMEAYLKEAFNIDKLRGELNDTNTQFHFLYCNEKLAGYLKVNEAPSQTDINDKNSLEIERIYVSNEFQGEGLGRYLIEQALNMAFERNKQYAWLGVWEKNDKAIRFYKKNGFYKAATHLFFMGDDEQTDYIMRKDLL